MTVASSLRDRSVMEARETAYRDRRAAVGKSAGVELAWLRPEATAAELGAGAGLIVLVLSGGTERAGLSLMARWGGPCVLLAHSSDNALAAALEMLSVAGTDGARCRIVQARPGWNEEIGRALRVMRAHHMMATSVLGAVGARDIEPVPDWVLDQQFRRTWGVDVRRIAMAELMDAYRGEEDEPARRIADELAAAARGCVEPTGENMMDSAKLYSALKGIITRYGLTAVTVRCFELLAPLQATACYALARLNDEGVPAACEGDMGAAVTMMLAKHLAGSPGFMANPAEIDERGGRILLAHCTIPMSMCDDFTLRSHYESGFGVGIQGSLLPGRVTLLRVGGPEFREVYVAAGTLVECTDRADLCRTQLMIELDSPAEAARILSRPLGNHHIVVKGDFVDIVRDYVDFYLA